MRLVADENVDFHVIERLQDDGHKVIAIAQLMAGATDTKVLKIAVKAKSLLLTYDKDFGELVFLQRKTSAGVLLIRLPRMQPAQHAKIIAAVIEEYGKELVGRFSVLNTKGLRIRAYAD